MNGATRKVEMATAGVTAWWRMLRRHACLEARVPLVYLVGGPMRTGKSIIAARFNRLSGISTLSSDELVHMLGAAAPDLGITHRKQVWVNRERLAPFVEAFAQCRAWQGSPIVIEGVLHPDSLRRLIRQYPDVCRGCFVGNATVTVAAKVENLQQYRERNPKDWLRGRPDKDLAACATRIIEASLEYRDAAGALGIPFFELSPDFETGVSQVIAYLKDGSVGN